MLQGLIAKLRSRVSLTKTAAGTRIDYRGYGSEIKYKEARLWLFWI